MAKRLLDIVVGTLLAVVATPVILLVCLYSAWAFRAWPLFTQRRIGRGGAEFSFVKVRTLPRTVAPYALKTAGDGVTLHPRTAVIRRLHLDEMPQLFLVPLGMMSLVGPRPKMPDAYEPVDARYGETRVRVPQGCTGLWQISKYCGALPCDHPEFDLFYVEHRTFRLDLWILWKTLFRVLGGHVGIELRDVPAWCLRQPEALSEQAAIIGEAG